MLKNLLTRTTKGRAVGHNRKNKFIDNRLQLKDTKTGYLARRVYFIPALGIKYNIKGRWMTWWPPLPHYSIPGLLDLSGWVEVAANAPVYHKQLLENNFHINYRK